MAEKTFFRIEPCKIGTSESHNERTEKIEYVFSEYSHLNTSRRIDGRNLQDIDAECRQLYREKVGQKVQKNTAFLKEAIFLIKPGTTREQLNAFTEKIIKLTKWKPVQAHIHRDEGHIDPKTGVFVPNLHVHVVFDVQDKETGKTLKFGIKDLKTIQDYSAEIFGLVRGGQKGKKEKHLKPLDYKIKLRREEVQALTEEVEKTKAYIQAQEKWIKEKTGVNWDAKSGEPRKSEPEKNTRPKQDRKPNAEGGKPQQKNRKNYRKPKPKSNNNE